MSKRVLLLGGHGKVAMLMYPHLLARSWHVTSVIRDPAHKTEILTQNESHAKQLDVLVRSLDDVKSEQDAKEIIDAAKPDYVIWSAGAGGKGGKARTYAIDRDAARYVITAALRTPSVTKFLMVSYIGSRRKRAPWFTDEGWAAVQKTNAQVLPDYAAAKVEADECLTALSLQRGGDFQGICLRPGTLTDDAPTQKVVLGHTHASGEVTRADVADVAVRLLERGDTRGYYDLLNGDEDVGKAVEQVVKDKIDCIEGEDIEGIKKGYKL